ncbi:MAG TPA: VWA domain-containing protein, partial [Gemmataceae bacterium]|nr:VWA domain-containing protein [Gemmataceae bacterium]
AIDISGSMAREIQGDKSNQRIKQARSAAELFVKNLPKKADCGLLLFDHEIQDKVPPMVDRAPVLQIIKSMEPRGGTAYLDAAKEAIDMLAAQKVKGKSREKALVLMTDGVDLHSKNTTLAKVIEAAKKAHVKIYTIGIGEPGTGKEVYSVLVLDHSLSMEQRAEDQDKKTKIEALHDAATKFVSILPDKAYSTVLPFGSIVGMPGNFSRDKARLTQQIKSLQPNGETAMLDGAYEAICALDAANLQGHKAVVVMTDGIDNMSRHRPDDVIRRAKEARVAMYMLAFGRESELAQAMPEMERIAKETGGEFRHARNSQALIRIFEDMSNALHDDGIDEVALKKLASETDGMYKHARDVNQLKIILQQISQEVLKKEYVITFDSPRGFDGTPRRISIKLVRASGEVVTDVNTNTAVRGVVVPEMNTFVYLGFLGVLGLMLAVPAALGRMLRSST